MRNPEEMLAEDMAVFGRDPLGFVMYAFPWSDDVSIQQVEMPPEYQARFNCKYGPDKWAIEFLEDLAEQVKLRGFDGRQSVTPIQFSTASGHGIGKSTLTAWLILWIMSCYPRCNGVVTANTAEQLRSKTWAELGKWWNMCITKHWFKYNSGRGNMSIVHVDHPQAWKCLAQTCREENSESFAGLHAASSVPFYIFDEASAVPDKIFEVREGGTTDGMPMTFDFGNPTRNTGKFFENCQGRFRHRYIVRSIDSRSVAITSKERIAEWVEDYGEDSDFVKVRVRGVFPAIGVFQFISSEDVRDAMDRESVEDKTAPLVIGVDVARFGDDVSVIYPRMGRDARHFEPRILQGADTVQVAGAVIDMVREFNDLGRKVRAIFVDGGGVGGGVVDQLKHLGYNPIEVLAQHKTTKPDKYRFRSDEMWGEMKDAIHHGLALPKLKTNIGTRLFQELTQREYDYTIKGQINLETKKDMKERGVESPNIADALALTYYAILPLEETVDRYNNIPPAQSDYNPLETDW